MRNLTELLKRFNLSLNQDKEIKKNIIQLIYEKTSITLKPDDLSLKNGILNLTAGSASKNEIRLKEELILLEIKERYGIRVSRIVYR